MKHRLVIDSVGDAMIDRKPAGIKFKGTATWTLHDKDGNLKAGDTETLNGVADVGINKLLDIMFGATAKFATWFMGLVDSSAFSGLAAGDTEASHAGWTENTGYTISGGSSVNRATWTPAAASGKSVSNTSAVAFTMTGAATIKGFFLCSDQLKATNTGTLWASALFASGDQVVANGDILNVTYTISAS